jgi:hypothetical protein
MDAADNIGNPQWVGLRMFLVPCAVLSGVMKRYKEGLSHE